MFDHNNFQNNMLPRDILKSMQILENFNDDLKEILRAELNAGNKIFDVTTGWPEPDTIMVQTRYPFKKRYEKESIVFKALHDPHYWKFEYASKDPVHLLVCPF